MLRSHAADSEKCVGYFRLRNTNESENNIIDEITRRRRGGEEDGEPLSALFFLHQFLATNNNTKYIISPTNNRLHASVYQVRSRQSCSERSRDEAERWRCDKLLLLFGAMRVCSLPRSRSPPPLALSAPRVRSPLVLFVFLLLIFISVLLNMFVVHFVKMKKTKTIERN